MQTTANAKTPAKPAKTALVAPVTALANTAQPVAVAPVALPITARGSSAVPLTAAQLVTLQQATVASIAHYLVVGFGSSAVQPKPFKANGACGAVWAMVQAAHKVLGVPATTAQLVQLGQSFTPPLNAGNIKIEASRAKKHFALLAAAQA